MRKLNYLTIAFSITILFFIQLAGTLVESIYILNLLNTALDERALGLLFFFSPLLLVFFRQKTPPWFTWTVFGLLFLSRGVTPYLGTNGRLLSSGIGTASVLLLLSILLSNPGRKHDHPYSGKGFSIGFALGVGLSILLRSVNFSIDYSLTAPGSWVGWIFGILLGIALRQSDLENEVPTEKIQKGKVTSAICGLFLIFALVFFIFSAPAVLARWTEGNYVLIVSITSLLTVFWVFLLVQSPNWLKKISPGILSVWNGLFTISLLATIFAHHVPLPATPNSAPVVVGQPSMLQHLLTYTTLLLYPVIILDFRVFIKTIQQATPSPRELMPGMILGSLCLILLVFMIIFSNVWGYVEPVSLFFRNKFWLPFALIAAFLTLLSALHSRKGITSPLTGSNNFRTGWAILLASIFLITAGFSLRTNRVRGVESNRNSLLVMTYNIQAANDQWGEKAYERQLDLIRQVNPDILALQESDTTRISLNNNDYVRYFSGKLGYYSYYGPKTVSGTFGTAILSRFPLKNTHSIYSFSDQDEIGTAVAEVEIHGEIFTIYNVHPDGSDTAMLVFADTLLNHINKKEKVVALGDYNLHKDEIPYQRIDAELLNAWTSVYPAGSSDTRSGISENDWIDHIFLSPDLQVRDPVYLLAPESHTDHPAHWALVYWE